MPNFAVFNTDPDDLRALIFGKNPNNVAQPLVTDNQGNLKTVVVDGNITVLGGTIDNVLSATIAGGTLNTINSVLGATITGGTLNTINSVLGATITGGTLNTINSVLGATITSCCRVV